jgi:hypothetical protein
MSKLKYNKSHKQTAEKLLTLCCDSVLKTSGTLDYPLAYNLAIDMASGLADVYYDLKYNENQEMDKFCVDMHLYFKNVKNKLIQMKF